MPRQLQLFILLFIPVNLFAQQWEISGSYSLPRYFDKDKDPGNRSSYVESPGFSVGVSCNNIPVKGISDTIPTRLSLFIVNYGGEAHTSSDGHGGGGATDMTFRKTVAALTFYPFVIPVYKQLSLSLGFDFNYLIHEDQTAKNQSWSYMIPGTKQQNSEKVKANNFIFGLDGRIAWNIRINNTIYLIPEYRFYKGMLNEYTDMKMKSYRHDFALGIGWRK